jgi:hypothetical protein
VHSIRKEVFSESVMRAVLYNLHEGTSYRDSYSKYIDISTNFVNKITNRKYLINLKNMCENYSHKNNKINNDLALKASHKIRYLKGIVSERIKYLKNSIIFISSDD